MFTSVTPTSALPAFREEHTKGVTANVKASPPVGEDLHIVAGIPDVVLISKLLACLLNVGVFHAPLRIVADVISTKAKICPPRLDRSPHQLPPPPHHSRST